MLLSLLGPLAVLHRDPDTVLSLRRRARSPTEPDDLLQHVDPAGDWGTTETGCQVEPPSTSGTRTATAPVRRVSWSPSPRSPASAAEFFDPEEELTPGLIGVRAHSARAISSPCDRRRRRSSCCPLRMSRASFPIGWRTVE